MKNWQDRPWLAHYAPGVPADADIPDESLYDSFEEAVRRFGDRTALVFFGGTLTYRQLENRILRAASALKGLGVKAGDRVALVLPNCPQHVIAYYAVLRLGAVVVEHNPLYTADEMAFQFNDHGASVAVVWDKAADHVRSATSGNPLMRIIRVDLTTALPLSRRAALRLPIARARATREAMTVPGGGGLSFEQLVRSAQPLPVDHPRPSATDLALLQYTGGTTGAPKGAMLTHHNLLANAVEGRAWVPGLDTGEETIYAVLPFFHVYGLTLGLSCSVRLGATTVLFPRFDIDQLLSMVKKYPPTFLPAVPPIYERLADAAVEHNVDLSSIKVALSGAMSLPVDTVEKWEKVTGSYLVEGYGMTESSPITVGNPVSSARRPGTVGVPFPNTYVRVVDPDHPEVERAQGESGELLVKGPQVFAGYWNRPQETAATLLPGGWLRTGDIVVMDQDGFITIVDRIKELIITGGFNVYPTEVEEVLKGLPEVADAAVVGIPHEHHGEEVVAAVVLEPDAAQTDPSSLRAACREHLAAYKVPRRVVVVDELPRSLIGKVLRRQVRDSLQDKPAQSNDGSVA